MTIFCVQGMWLSFSESAMRMQLSLEAEPKDWKSSSSLPEAASNQLHPFMRARFGCVNLNLATLQHCRWA
jgi:hypothetical protein